MISTYAVSIAPQRKTYCVFFVQIRAVSETTVPHRIKNVEYCQIYTKEELTFPIGWRYNIA